MHLTNAVNSSHADGEDSESVKSGRVMPHSPAGTNWEFDGFEVLTEKRLLLGGGTPLPLTSKAFDTLVVLIANRDRVVTKDELLQAVWPDVEVEEGNLTQQIFLLRKALGESAQQPRYIVTVPGHGYRFTAAVTEMPAGSATTRSSTLIRAGLAVFGIAAVLATAIGWNWMARDRTAPAWDLTNARIEKVTESGKATYSAISPDGLYVAYVENDGDEYSLWREQIATEGKTAIIPPQPLVLTYLSFSPDGEYIYFTRGTPRRGGFVLFRVPANGGLEEPILDDVDTPISFSPDGREFVFMRGAGAETHIVIAAAKGGSHRNLATRKSPLAFGFFAPDWSPDGKVVAAILADGSRGSQSIVLLPVDGSSSRELYTSDHGLGRVRWLPDGSGLLTIVSEGLEGPHQFARLSGGSIWRIAYPGGRAERLTSDLAEYDPCCLDIGANGNSVAGIVNTLVSDLWIAPANQLEARTQITSGHPVITPHSWLEDHDTIVYRDVSGRLNAVHKDTRAFSLPLPDGHKAVGGVSACGDGYVVFRAVPGNHIWRVSASAGGPVKLTTGSFDSSPACSHDGKSVLYVSRRPDPSSIWRVSIGGGEPTPLVQSESYDVLPSPTGRLIYYWTFEWEQQPVRTRVARWIVMSSSERTRLHQFDVPVDATIGMMPVWAPDESGLDYVVTRNGVSNIWRQQLTAAPPVPITNFRTGKIFSFAWSRDGKWLSLGSGANRTDVVVMSRQR